jgi:hypothetical protein
MRRSLLVLLVASFLAAVSLAAPAQASHSWGSYHWARTANPFTVALGDNVGSAWDGYLTAAGSQWSQSSVLDTTAVAGTGGKRCKATSGRVEVCSGSYGRNGWLGLASIWASGSHITQGTVKVNDTYFAMAAYNTPDERAHVMCQEIGHTFGLGHTSEDGSTQNTCMDYSQSPTSTEPNAHDYAQLEAIYAHLDSTTTVGNAAASTNSSAVSDDPSSWGREVSRSGDGRHSTFVRDLGNGQSVITEVTWAR